jgi:hypothetical protein
MAAVRTDHYSPYGMMCPRCNNLIIAPSQSAYVSANSALHCWSSRCLMALGRSFGKTCRRFCSDGITEGDDVSSTFAGENKSRVCLTDWLSSHGGRNDASTKAGKQSRLDVWVIGVVAELRTPARPVPTHNSARVSAFGQSRDDYSRSSNAFLPTADTRDARWR